MRCHWISALFFAVITIPNFVSSTWWFLSKFQLGTASNPRMYCDHIPGMERKQRRLCQKHPDHMVQVGEGAATGIKECQYQFRQHRWNCSTIDRDASVFGKSLVKSGSREAAFVYAISSAGVVHSISRACNRGDLLNCACDKTRLGKHHDQQGEFAWGGCSTNVRYGSNFARQFIDARERKMRDSRALMNLHNNRVGRKALHKLMRHQCKCHGVSGACNVRTCWTTLPEFREVGSYLKERYDVSLEVSSDPSGTTLITADHLNDNRKSLKTNPPQVHDLVYLEHSSDYCSFDPLIGSIGTAGRPCNKTSKGIDGCDLLCCGRGYDTRRVLVTTPCNCTFKWCCSVECKTCTQWKDEHFCKPLQSFELNKFNSTKQQNQPPQE
ncbi:Protein Wnt-16 [Daphnia magna]|uniref:Protein Wnt n=1 Tax=Daphnia magna TaxID=35525 RepID=A0A164UHN6_9CRUS|nr:Protein Wnt-16 [Daphnia magna]